MNIEKVRLVYFSATGTTQKILEGIAGGICVEDVAHINLTLPGNDPKAIPPFSGELVIMGAPVYGGRIPPEAVNRFRQLKGAGTLAVLIVVYGNREFEDALLELKNLSVELGFIPVAGGAFIGEHSFATEDMPIAAGRPDGPDIQTARDFGKKIKEKIGALASPDAQEDLQVPGSFPYEAKGARPMAVSPLTSEDACTGCGTCADVCPTAAISVDDIASTETGLCIRCCACIKSCPENARFFKDEMMEKITKWLYDNCSARKEPQMFGVGPES